MSQYCTVCEPDELQILNEIANLQVGSSPKEGQKIMEKSKELAELRWREAQEKLKLYKKKLREREEELFSEAFKKILEGENPQEIARMIAEDKERQELKDKITALELEPREVTSEDIENLLKDYVRKGYLQIEWGKFKVTSKGAQLLGRGFLRKIMQKLTKRGIGMHRVEKTGYSSAFSKLTRPYELGDTYDRINIEKTFLNALEKGRKMNELDIEDIEIYELLHQTRLNIGIIIDESGSMRTCGRFGCKRKIDAVVETALALAELIRTNYPQDKIRVFTFSQKAREIRPWELLNIQTPEGWTDIKAGIRAYRVAVTREGGDKQAYLITDMEPNFEDGKYVGFQQATRGVLEEALRCRKENITLNIIMLDQTYHLKEFASMVAKQSVGRVAFTSPENLGEAILEDYLAFKKEKLLCS
jgi:uncharacterized protein with von Willebrand factor type A (vWA) domain